MKRIQIAIMTVGVFLLSLIIIEESEADGMDCSEMVEMCKSNNPYHWPMSEYAAYNLGCTSDGLACETIQKQ